MAHGDLLEMGRAAADVQHHSYLMLDGAAAVDEGKWVDVRGFSRMSLDLFGSFAATVQIRASNERVPSGPGRILGQNLSGPCIVSLDVPVRWLKVAVVDHKAGVVHCILNAVSA